MAALFPRTSIPRCCRRFAICTFNSRPPMPVSMREAAERRWRNLPLRYKGLAVIAIPVVCVLLEVAWLAHLHQAEEASASWTLHTQRVQLEADRLLAALVDVETGDRGYAITGDPIFLEPYRRAVPIVAATIKNLRQLTADNPGQQQRLQEMDQLAQRKLQIAAVVIAGTRARFSQQPIPPQLPAVVEGKQVMDAERQQLTEFMTTENDLLAVRSTVLQQQWRRSTWVLWGSTLISIIGGVLAVLLFSHSIAGRLVEIAARGARFAAGLPAEAPPAGRDEISHLEHQLHNAYELVAARTGELQLTEISLRQRNAELAVSNGELEAFSYSVSHDLRAPLRHIDGYSKILMEDFGPRLEPEAQRLLGVIREATGQMSQLIDALLRFARLGRGGMRRSVTDLSALAKQEVAKLEPENKNRQIEWRVGALGSADCDAELMRQVFANLLTNAIKYSRGQPRSVIEIGRQTDGVFFVRDNGVGFDMKYADKLFGLFQRLHRQQEFEGIGLGLAAAARIVRRHGGRIWAKAAPGSGATFFFSLDDDEAAPATLPENHFVAKGEVS